MQSYILLLKRPWFTCHFTRDSALITYSDWIINIRVKCEKLNSYIVCYNGINFVLITTVIIPECDKKK